MKYKIKSFGIFNPRERRSSMGRERAVKMLANNKNSAPKNKRKRREEHPTNHHSNMNVYL